MTRVTLPVTMKLLSDAVFGSGFSVPGGEDIAVCRDERGYPFVKGSTWKGLLRESLENLAAWGEADPADVDALMGEEGWSGPADGRRLQFTGLTLDSPPSNPEDCYDARTFTSLENGVVKPGALRTAACIRKNLVFSGQIQCAQEDVELLRSALAGIKWAGTMRSRGFGRVHFSAGEAKPLLEGEALPAGTCIRYRLRTQLPVIVTDQARSTGNSYETQGFLPGSAVRGAVIGALSAREPEWFQAHKIDLLSGRTRFLDAVPLSSSLSPLPSVRGFYEDKEGTRFENVVISGEFTPGLKRAKLGEFCALDGETVRYWAAKTGGTNRIRRGKSGEDATMFQVRWLDAGQDFEGYILLDDPALAPKVSQALGKTLWLGADRYAGFGKCELTLLEAGGAPAWLDAYGYRTQEEIGTELYLLAVSPLSMADGKGDPCGLDEGRLAQKLGVEGLEILHCATGLTQAGGYNRTWQCRAPLVRMYDRGSLFHIRCSRPPALEAVRRIQREGLGIRRAEGFGQVLFLRPGLVEGLRGKEAPEKAADAEAGAQAELRRARYRWVMAHAGQLNAFRLSKSQAGTIQTLCQKAIANDGNCEELNNHLEHNLTGRGAVHGARFTEVANLVRSVLNRPLADTLGVECSDSIQARLELLSLLFDHSRKGRRDG